MTSRWSSITDYLRILGIDEPQAWTFVSLANCSGGIDGPDFVQCRLKASTRSAATSCAERCSMRSRPNISATLPSLKITIDGDEGGAAAAWYSRTLLTASRSMPAKADVR